ncbi:protein NATD1 [Anabrus simplex]|uniref:protein NATD1 n=1 Tax=Anabrus simplex TaxID=316456 RepID=UPI0035A3BD46
MLRRSARILQKVVSDGESKRGILLSPNLKWEVRRDESSKQFFIKMGSDKATVEYETLNGVIELQETNVPPAFQGKGIGKILAQGVFDYCVKHNLKMKLNCSFLQKFYEDNYKRYQKYVVE